MGAPLVAATALNSRTGRKILAGATILILLAIAFAMTPLIAVPLAVAGSAASTGITGSDAAPAVSGEWGYPLRGDYFTGRG